MMIDYNLLDYLSGQEMKRDIEKDFVSIPDDIIKVSSWYNQRVNPNLRDKEG